MISEGLGLLKFLLVYRKYRRTTNLRKKEKLSNKLCQLLEKEGGILLKIGQYLASYESQDAEFQNLIHNLNSKLNSKEVEHILARELGFRKNKITDISEESYNASIGQVHRAFLDESNSVAIKLKYPHIEKKLRNQLKVLNMIPENRKLKKWNIQLKDYKRLIKDLLKDEINYLEEEYKHEALFEIFKEDDQVLIPWAYKEFCTKNILVTDFIEGERIDELSNWEDRELTSISETILYSFFKLMLNQFIQGDSNHGNYIFHRKDGVKLGLIDFGQVQSITTDFRNSLFSLILKKIESRPIDFLSHFKELGFEVKKLVFIEEELSLICDILFEPFLSNEKVNLKEWKYKEHLEQVLGDNKWWFRSAGGKEFFLLIKSFVGVIHLLKKINKPLYWQQILLEALGDQKNTYLEYDPKPQKVVQRTTQLKSKKIYIEVFENNNQKVNITLPINALFHLENYLDKNLKKKLYLKNIDLDKISNNAIRNHALPQTLFEFEEKNKKYKVHIS